MLRDIWQSVGWEPTPLQRKVLLSRARSKLAPGGRRAGKSQIGGMQLVPEAFRANAELDLLRRMRARREYWIVGPEYSDAEKEFRVLWGALEELGFPFDHPGSYNNPFAGEMRLSLFKGRFLVQAKSAKYPGTLVGEALSGAIFAEAAKLRPSVFQKYIRPTLADYGGWTGMYSTPEGRNWFYDFWSVGQDSSRPEWASWRAPAWSNPHVYPAGVHEPLLDALSEASRRRRIEGILRNRDLVSIEGFAEPVAIEVRQGERGGYPAIVGTDLVIDPEIWAMFQDMSLEMFNQEVVALFTEFVGRVFKDFDEEYHVTEQEFNPSWITYAAADYGFTNPLVWLLLQVDPHQERVHVLDEYYETERTTEEAGAEIRARGLAPSSVVKFFPDPAEPDRTKVLSDMLRISAHRGGSIDLRGRIEWIRRGLKTVLPHIDRDHPDNGPGLTIHRRCVHTIHEFNVWKYKETFEKAAEKGRSAPEIPEARDNHTPEALGRFYSGLFGSPWRGANRQSKVNVRRG